jgi:hypothetical protein
VVLSLEHDGEFLIPSQDLGPILHWLENALGLEQGGLRPFTPSFTVDCRSWHHRYRLRDRHTHTLAPPHFPLPSHAPPLAHVPPGLLPPDHMGGVPPRVVDEEGVMGSSDVDQDILEFLRNGVDDA